MFNPNARAEIVKFDDEYFCLVIDDALLEPEKLVQWAAARADAFKNVDISAYPGIYLMAPDEVVRAVNEFFRSQVRRLFDVRRCESLHCRYSMVTLAPEALQPYQRICHSDARSSDPRMSVQASVLYLFKDPGLGGTSFYAPNRPVAEVAALFKDATSLTRTQFAERYPFAQGYMNDGNDYFRRVGGIPARWNRLIFYDGDILHSGDIPAPEKLTADPLTGRLTLNGFFTSRRNLAR